MSKRTVFRVQATAPVGARPGTLQIPKDSPAPRLRMMRYTAEECSERDLTSVDEIPGLLHGGPIAWIDVQGLGNEAVIQELGRIFGLHPLVLENLVNASARPKLENHENYALYVSRQAYREDDGSLHIEPMSVIFGKDYVLTVQHDYGDVLDPVRERLRQGKGPMRRSRPDYLAYAIIDAVVDGFYPILEVMADRLEQLEEEVITNATPRVLNRVNDNKRDLLALRRCVWPQRDAINQMVRDPSEFMSETVRVYLRDCYDHCVQVTDVVETYREVTSSLLNTYLSSVANRTNDVMKVLTIMASIFIPLTFMAGIYGMNFDHIPELHFRYGYFVLMALMAIVGGGMLFYFRRLGWIGGDKKPKE